jgi:hypothetical protein
MVSVTPEARPAHAFEIAVRSANSSVDPDVVRHPVRPLNSMHTSTRWLAIPIVEKRINATNAANRMIPMRTGFFKLGSPANADGLSEERSHAPEFFVALINETLRR